MMYIRRQLPRAAGLAALAALALLYPSCAALAASKVKLRGYITARKDQASVAILSDVVHFGPGTTFAVQNASSAGGFGTVQLEPGVLIEAEGVWQGHHQFLAEKITLDSQQFEKEIHESAYLEQEPAEAAKIASGLPARLKVDGEVLLLDQSTARSWSVAANPASTAGAVSAAMAANSGSQEQAAVSLAGHQVRYEGVRRADGTVAARTIELGPGAPPGAYKIPHDILIARGQDPKTGTDLIEFRRGTKVEGRMKLLAVKDVQQYVTNLGRSLLPPSAAVTSRALEFRFFVVEDPSVNAQALPDGTVLINTGLLGAVENEAQLAFVLSHEIAHTLQAHLWRHTRETRGQRIAIMIAAIAGSGFIGDLALFLGALGLEAVVNGYSRRIENQADRLGLQNIIEHGYDPREAPKFSEIFIERYGDRSTSKIWSNHDSMVLRGSFLATQINRQYPGAEFNKGKVDTEAFRAMKDALGPVKIM